MCDGNCSCEKDLEVQEQELEQDKTNLSADERFIELEIAKEEIRIEKEIWLDTESKHEFIKTEQFDQGLTDSAYYVGLYTGLLNGGISTDKAWEMTINAQNIKYNLEATKMNADMNVNVAKQQSIVIDKNAI